MTHPITESMAKAFFASEYANAYDEAEMNGIDTGINPSGCDWMDLMPDEMDSGALKAADSLTRQLVRDNGKSLDELYDLAESLIETHGGGDRELDQDMFGHYLAMQAMGHGVGLDDAFGRAVYEAIKVPYVECSLEQDYFGIWEED